MRYQIILLTSLAYLGLTSAAQAYSGYLDQMRVQYQKAFQCNLCHAIAPAGLTPFGRDFRALRQENPGLLATIRALEKLDSDQDGWLNGAELKSGSSPSNAQNQPQKTGYNKKSIRTHQKTTKKTHY